MVEIEKKHFDSKCERSSSGEYAEVLIDDEEYEMKEWMNKYFYIKYNFNFCNIELHIC